MMDWFAWLSKTGLDPSAVYDYGLTFSNNELEESDFAYFDHQFLQSMGISIAKHRLEILKLARKHCRKGRPVRFTSFPVSRLLVVIRGMKRKLGEYVKGWSGHEPESSAIVVIRTKGGGYHGGMWRDGSASTKLKRNKAVSIGGRGHGRLLLTDGSDSVDEPVVSTARKEGKFEHDGYWAAAGVEELRWDALFQDLKPT